MLARYLYLIALTLFLHIALAEANTPPKAEPLVVALQPLSGQQKQQYQKVFADFESLEGIRVEIKIYSRDEYNRRFYRWINEKEGPDVLYWQGGQRLFDLAKNGAFVDLSEDWNTRKLDQYFKITKSVVSRNEKIFGIPFSYYNWGFFYNKELFDSHKLTPPANWKEFLSVCETLKSKGIYPLATGDQDKWLALAWFDFINLRVNGLEFHQSLMQGQVSYNSPQIRTVLEHWKGLIDANYFHPEPKSLTINQSLPYLFHKKTGMYLLSNISARLIPGSIQNKIGFFPFPEINSLHRRFEITPTDVFVIPQHGTNLEKSRKLLMYLANSKIQSAINKGTGAVPANESAIADANKFTQKGLSTLRSSQGVSQYFDRDNNYQMAEAGTAIFHHFMQTANIEETIIQLEKARIISYKR